MNAPLRRLARLAAARPGAVAPFAVRGKATQSVHRAAGTLSSDFGTRVDNDDTARLPFFASWIGNLLGASLSDTQLEAFAGKYMGGVSGDARAAPAEPSPEVAAALETARRERDAAVSRANAVDAEALTLRLRLAQTDAGAVEAVRAELRDAQLEAAETRVALNALKFARTETRVVEGSGSAVGTPAGVRPPESITRRESELKLAVRRLERELERANERVVSAESASATFAASVVREVKAGTSAHPTFGALLRDFGYKKVYAMPAGRLADKSAVRVYEQQRAFRSDRAVTIADRKAADKFAVPGVISLAEGTARTRDGDGSAREPASGARGALAEFFRGPERSVSILDGQHRVGAIEILLRRGVIRDTDEVLVEVFPDVSDAKAAELFTEINAAQPVRFVDMPGVVAPEMKWALEGAAGALKNKYPAMFSESARCKIPNVNLDALREQLHEAEVARRFGLRTESDFTAWMGAENARLAGRSEKQWLRLRPKRGRGSAGSKEAYLKALAKAREHGLFLGMCETWLDVKD
jgi:hypothetical protein